jgi:hypothetical protein
LTGVTISNVTGDTCILIEGTPVIADSTGVILIAEETVADTTENTIISENTDHQITIAGRTIIYRTAKSAAIDRTVGVTEVTVDVE